MIHKILDVEVIFKKYTRRGKNNTSISIPSSYKLNLHTASHRISKFIKTISIAGITISEEDNVNILNIHQNIEIINIKHMQQLYKNFFSNYLHSNY